ncbi:MAG TPA: polyphosphate kinase 2 family protein [Pirellulales bacterium]|nr:polyphosphate kinase 2 family protein [Pirellulales bacterium]
MQTIDEMIDLFRVPSGKRVKLKDYDPSWSGDEEFPKADRKRFAEDRLAQDISALAEAQYLLYASNSWSLLLIFQAMDAAGKDGTIKHVMSGVNPQGCQVYSFKHPSAEELNHNFLWRCMKALPERGRIGIFNRSYYEEVLIVKVHPELLVAQHVPDAKPNAKLWKKRYDDINRFERHLTRNGTKVLKFFLHISKDEQRKRFLERVDDPKKHWKFSPGDLAERERWDDYMRVYEEALSGTSTKWAPWYVVPADHKWVSRTMVAAIITRTVDSLNLNYPEVTPAQAEQIAEAKRRLEAERP